MSGEVVRGWVEGDEWYPVAVFHKQRNSKNLYQGKVWEFPKELLDRYDAAREAFLDAETELIEHWKKVSGYQFG